MRQPTVRLRLTLWYGGLFLLAGMLLVTVSFVLVSRSLPVQHDREARVSIAERLGLGPEVLDLDGSPDHETGLFDQLFDEIAADVRRSTLEQLVVQSLVALLAVAAVSIGLGWFVAGRMLRPVHDIAATVRAISEENLEARVALDGPSDELRELAEQFDAMLDRLQAAFDTQREFVAYASHELRTPLTIIKTELDVTLSDERATRDDLDRAAEVARRAIARTELLIDHLLTLARAGEPVRRRDRIDLAAVAQRAMEGRAADLAARDMHTAVDLQPATVEGDPLLLDSLVANLVDNAIRYNRTGGVLQLSTGEENGGSALSIRNDGPEIPPEQVERLFERFTRLDDSRSRDTGGYGLGLAIVRAIVRGHGGEVHAAAREEGGLAVSVTLPRASHPPARDRSP